MVLQQFRRCGWRNKNRRNQPAYAAQNHSHDLRDRFSARRSVDMASFLKYPICWRASDYSEALAIYCASVSCYRLPKNVLGLAVLEAKLKLVQVQRQVLLAHMVVAAYDTTLNQRPEGFDVIGMHFAAHVLAFAVVDRF